MTLLSKKECSALRGFAIIGIFLHNYLHWLGQMVKENEYQFHQDYADRFLSIMANPDGNFLYHAFSFFGHYGVPVFLFLSGYGLVLKYEGGTEGICVKGTTGVWQFLAHHYNKLFPMMLLGFVCFAMVDWVTPGRHHWTWLDIVAQLTMTINVLPDPDHIIWPGPYWFFGLMMQLYLIYILLLHRCRHWSLTVALVLLCWALQAMCAADPEGETLNRIRYNSIGGMLPFAMGILLARAKATARIESALHAPHIRAGWTMVCIAAAIVVCCFSLNFHTWLWAPAFVVVANVALVKALPQIGIRMLEWVGTLSAAIFVCHPVTRKIFIPISRGGEVLDGLAIYIVSTIVLAIIFRMVISQLQKKQ